MTEIPIFYGLFLGKCEIIGKLKYYIYILKILGKMYVQRGWADAGKCRHPPFFFGSFSIRFFLTRACRCVKIRTTMNIYLCESSGEIEFRGEYVG